MLILKKTSKQEPGMPWVGLIWLRNDTGGGLLECGDELSISTKCLEFLD